MRLLDRILLQGFKTSTLEIPDRLKNLERAQLVVIDNVAAYYAQELDRKIKTSEKIAASDFPNVMLPFEMTFMDMRLSESSALGNVFCEAGLVMEMRGPKGIHEAVRAGTTRWLSGSDGEENPFLSEKVAWCLLVSLLFRYRWTGRVEHYADFSVPVNAEGGIVSIGDRLSLGVKFHPTELHERIGDQPEFEQMLVSDYVYPAFLALSFMHCRNVKFVEERPPEKLSMKHARKTGRPLLRYRVLQIDHAKQILERTGHASTRGLKEALHICRGSFRTYGTEGHGLLFGKHAGRVWVPMYARGTKEKGIVVKDYEVK